jgi:hypothetical protein
MVVCPLSMEASVVVVHEPTEAQVVMWPSQVPVTRPSSVQVVMTQYISYARCHGKVVKSIKAKPPVLAALELGLTVCSHRHA